MDFATRFHNVADTISPFCLGVDPSTALLDAASLPDDCQGVRSFYERLLQASDGLNSVIKPQIAYFERFGADGLLELKRLVDMAREKGLLVIMDAKRGDIDSTCAAYAQAYLGPKSYFNADALTVNAYMGFGSLLPILDVAAEYGKGIFVVLMSSNPEGAPIQTALVQDAETTVAGFLAEQIAAFNLRKEQKVIGGVLGATIGDRLADMVARMDNGLILAPGIGHQGATFADLEVAFSEARRTLVPTMARGIVREGFSGNVLRAIVHEKSAQARAFRKGDGMAAAT
jgi:orotidine-5'-phosphate decarboxylase